MNNLMTREKWQTIKSRYSIYLVLIVMIIVCNLLNENFLSPRNISNISAQSPTRNSLNRPNTLRCALS